MTVEHAPVPLKRKLLDFANVLKAFIGANYLTVAFAFSCAGYLLGIIGLILVAILTDHCCALIIDCKKIVLRHFRNTLPHNDPIADADNLAAGKDDPHDLHFLYDDVGRAAMGKAGVALIKSAVIFTQFGFGCGYFIFLSQIALSLLNITSAKGTMGANSMLVVVYPLPILILLCLQKDVRKFATVSMMANVMILAGYFVVLGYEASVLAEHEQHSDPPQAFRWATFPIFIGMMCSAWEGIGTVIPIQSSMRENRPAFRLSLGLAIAVTAVMLATSGLMGYLTFTSSTAQIIILNFPSTAPFVIVLRFLLMASVICTYPLQMFPVVQLAETKLRQVWKKRVLHRDDIESSSSLLHDTKTGKPGAISPEKEVLPLWFRNSLRVVLVCATCGIGIIFRNDFAYFAALVGAVGGSSLSYILPTLFHNLLLRKANGAVPHSKRTVVKNYIIMVFGIIAGIVSLVTVIMSFVSH